MSEPMDAQSFERAAISPIRNDENSIPEVDITGEEVNDVDLDDIIPVF